ncbi:uncharacterized protein LOC131599752 [Vicia villosa]|uniref:uncharacterized protein LOC131599752 n=1 Tax=Vicia villosa TaxID=3911 RepID=UPI00273CF1C2|nr:uncharacterized protein LOC131599752 [Vicia villosa]
MKKLYRKGTVHPSSPPPTVSEQLSFLPATIFTLIVALSPEDKEVIAYLISCSSSSSSFYKNPNRKTKDAVKGEHLPLFHCNCFHCYMSYWIRWNSSPNHQLIHTIIDDFEDFLSQTANKRKEKKNRKASNNRNKNNKSSELNRSELESLESVTESTTTSSASEVVDVSEEIDFVDSVEVEDESEEKVSSMRKLMSFIGEKVWFRWCVWGR